MATTVHRDRLRPACLYGHRPAPGDILDSPIAPGLDRATDPVALELHEEADNALSHQRPEKRVS